MFLGPLGPACSPHMKRISRVFPHPVSPMTITGILHLTENNVKVICLNQGCESIISKNVNNLSSCERNYKIPTKLFQFGMDIILFPLLSVIIFFLCWSKWRTNVSQKNECSKYTSICTEFEIVTSNSTLPESHLNGHYLLNIVHGQLIGAVRIEIRIRVNPLGTQDWT